MERKDGAMESRKAGMDLRMMVPGASDPGCGEESSREDMSGDWKLLFPELGLHRLLLGRHPRTCQH